MRACDGVASALSPSLQASGCASHSAGSSSIKARIVAHGSRLAFFLVPTTVAAIAGAGVMMSCSGEVCSMSHLPDIAGSVQLAIGQRDARDRERTAQRGLDAVAVDVPPGIQLMGEQDEPVHQVAHCPRRYGADLGGEP